MFCFFVFFSFVVSETHGLETIFSSISQWLCSEGTVPLSWEQSPPNPWYLFSYLLFIYLFCLTILLLLLMSLFIYYLFIYLLTYSFIWLSTFCLPIDFYKLFFSYKLILAVQYFSSLIQFICQC